MFAHRCSLGCHGGRSLTSSPREQANVCQPSYETNGGSLVVTTELFISRVDNSPLGEYGFVPFAEIVEGFERMWRWRRKTYAHLWECRSSVLLYCRMSPCPVSNFASFVTVTKDVYDQYGEVHGGSVGEAMCGANEICKGPNPDRIMEGNSYFGMGTWAVLKKTTNVKWPYRRSSLGTSKARATMQMRGSGGDYG